MAEIRTEKFSVKNLDCASCAAKIENGLKAVAGIDDAVLDFANLTLHVTGQRDDGYHLLDSLVVFADAADHLSAEHATDLTLTVRGVFSQGVPDDHTNLMLRAAQALRSARGITAGAAMTLEKNLPHAAGIGSGSSDAAATLGMLAVLWNVAPLPWKTIWILKPNCSIRQSPMSLSRKPRPVLSRWPFRDWVSPRAVLGSWDHQYDS